MESTAGVHCFDMRKIAESHELRNELKRTNYQSLTGNDSSKDSYDDTEVKGALGYGAEEGIREGQPGFVL